MNKFGLGNYFILGIRRSGNHAISNWLLPQFETGVRYYDAYYYFKFLNERVTHKRYQLRGNLKNNFRVNYFGVEDAEYLRVVENLHIWKHNFNNALKLNGTNKVVSDNNKVIVILRNPWNIIASRIAWKVKEPFELILKDIDRLWNSYFDVYVNEKEYVIIYDKWFKDIDYRKQIANDLNLNYSDINLNRMSNNGGGSSFNELEYNGNAQNMSVLNRYKSLIDNEKMKTFMKSEHGLSLKDKWNYLCDREDMNNLKIK